MSREAREYPSFVLVLTPLHLSLFDNLQADGMDCGDAMSEMISAYLEQTGLEFYRFL